MQMKALIATDGSEASTRAAHEAAGLLHPDAELQIVTVIPEREDPLETAGGFEGPLITEEEAAAEHRDATRAGKAALRATLEQAGEPARTDLIEGDDPGRIICDLAEERGVDVLVVGESDKGWFSRLIHGSVMEYAVKHAPCPVLVVRSKDEDDEG
jgi:nucleotide-binding universal stress UspA family protein